MFFEPEMKVVLVESVDVIRTSKVKLPDDTTPEDEF